MNEDAVRRVYAHAMGCAEAMSKDSSAVAELIAVAEQRRDVLQKALERAETEAGREERRRTEGGDDASTEAPWPEAPALLATRLLRQALDDLGAREG